jgi:DNA-binding Lrp family transcriptional regulator
MEVVYHNRQDDAVSDVTIDNDSGKQPKKVRNRKPKPYSAKIKEIYRTTEIDKKIVDIIHDNPLVTYKEIGALLDISTRTVQLSMRKPGTRKMLDDMRASINQLVSRGQMIGLRRLMRLAMSKDEWIALQASKILTAPVLNVAKVSTEFNGQMTYEVQVGPTGQIFQTVKPMTDQTQNPNRFPTPREAMLEVLAEAKEVDESNKNLNP